MRAARRAAGNQMRHRLAPSDSDGDSARARHGSMSQGERPVAGRVDGERHAGIDHERARTHEDGLEESDGDLGQRDRDNGGGACLTRRFSRQQRRRYRKPDERI